MNFRDPKAQLRVNCPDAVSDIDALEPIQSQYAASPRLVELLVRMAALYDLAGKDVMTWWFKEFNPAKAEGHGLDVWARIVGGTRTIRLVREDMFGFKQNESLSWMPDGDGETEARRLLYGFIFNDQSMTYISRMSDADFRTMIFWKASANIGAADAQTINSLLRRLLGDSDVFVQEMGIMAIRVISRFKLTPVQRALFRQYGIAGRGAGVYIDWVEFPRGEAWFGFSSDGREGSWQTFGRGFDADGLHRGGSGTFWARSPIAYNPE